MNNIFHKKRYSFVHGLLAGLLCFITSSFLSAQDAPVFTVKLKMDIDGGSLEHALITITKNGSPDRVIDPNKGKYNVDLALGAEYSFVFTKMGYISKTVIIDTHVPSGREKADFAKFTATVSLAKQPEDEVITYSQPVGRIKYSMQEGDFDYDKDYTATAEAMIKKAESNPAPKPKPPPPPPPVSKPIPVEVKKPEYKPEPPKPKPVVIAPEVPQKKIVKNKEEKTIQEDRRKLTIITVNIDGTNYVYRREQYSWGGLYYYKDGKNISERTFEKETE